MENVINPVIDVVQYNGEGQPLLVKSDLARQIMQQQGVPMTGANLQRAMQLVQGRSPSIADGASDDPFNLGASGDPSLAANVPNVVPTVAGTQMQGRASPNIPAPTAEPAASNTNTVGTGTIPLAEGGDDTSLLGPAAAAVGAGAGAYALSKLMQGGGASAVNAVPSTGTDVAIRTNGTDVTQTRPMGQELMLMPDGTARLVGPGELAQLEGPTTRTALPGPSTSPQLGGPAQQAALPGQPNNPQLPPPTDLSARSGSSPIPPTAQPRGDVFVDPSGAIYDKSGNLVNRVSSEQAKAMLNNSYLSGIASSDRTVDPTTKMRLARGLAKSFR